MSLNIYKETGDDLTAGELNQIINEINNKTENVAGKSLINDTEIARLATVTNQDITGKANITDVYTKIETDGKVDNLQNQIDAIADGEVDIDLTNYYTKFQSDGKYLGTGFTSTITNKVDKESGKSLINDNEITRLSTVTNQDISGKADITLLDNKADIVSGLVPLTQLPPVYFSNVTGTGTLNDPYVVSGTGGGQASAEDYLKALAGYSDIEEKILYTNNGSFSWGAVPQGGELEKLDTPTLTMSEAQVDSFPLNWNEVINATSFTLQRDIQASFATVTTVYNGALRVYTDSGLAANTTYYYRLRANAAGFASSNYAVATGKTLATGNITPPAPTNAVVDDTNDFFNWTNAVGYANITNYEYTLDGGTTYVQATVKPLVIGNVAKAIGSVGIRVKADTGRNASGTLFNGVTFNTAAVKADKPTNPITDDVNDTFDWTNTEGFPLPYNYEYTLDSGTTYTTATEKPLYIGDINKAVGSVGIRVKSATGVLVSDTLFNTVAFIGSDGLTATSVTTWDAKDAEWVFSGSTIQYLGTTPNQVVFCSTKKIPVGGSFIIQCDGVGSAETATICVHTDYTATPNNGANVLWKGNRFAAIMYNQGRDPSATTIPGGVTPKGRIRGDGTIIYAERSYDNGATWTLLMPTATAPQPQQDLYMQSIFGGKYVYNVRYTGLVAV